MPAKSTDLVKKVTISKIDQCRQTQYLQNIIITELNRTKSNIYFAVSSITEPNRAIGVGLDTPEFFQSHVPSIFCNN